MRTAMTRLLDDLGPDFEQRWKQTALATRRAVVAELRDLYVMLEHRDAHLIARLRKGSIPPLRDHDDLPLLASAPQPTGVHQGSLFVDAGPDEAGVADADATPAAIAQAVAPAEAAIAWATPLPPPGTARENPFLPRSMLDRLQESRDRVASLGLPLSPGLAPAPSGAALLPLPPSHEQSDLERELRLKLGPVVESLIDAQMESLRSELRLRLRLEMDRLIADHLRK